MIRLPNLHPTNDTLIRVMAAGLLFLLWATGSLTLAGTDTIGQRAFNIILVIALLAAIFALPKAKAK